MERTGRIELHPAALGRRATQPVCLPARWLRPGNGLHRSKVVIRNESRLCAAGSFATSATDACGIIRNGLGQIAARNNGRGFGGLILGGKRPVGSERLTILAATLLLAACSTPATKIQTVEVKVPVATRPISPAQVPVPPAPLPPRPSSLSAAADVLLSRWCQAVSYFLKADPLLRVSAGEQQKPLPTYKECER